MIKTRLSSRSFQSIINDETLCDDLTTFNQTSSSPPSIVYRRFSMHYVSQEYVVRKENSTEVTKTESVEQEQSQLERTTSEQSASEPLNCLLDATPRNIAVIELISSEQRFLHDMKHILKSYITPILENNILSSSHVDALFLNWPSLTRSHEKLANALTTALKTDGEQISTGKILCEFIPDLITEYEVYFRFHPIATKCFREQLHLSSKFRAFMQKTKEQSYGIGTMGDANILTLPLQRVAKYPVLIYQILKNTSNTCSDYSHLNDSLAKANELRETINNAVDEEINRTKFEWLQKHVDCSKINEPIIFNSLTHSGDQRKLIHYSRMRLSKSVNHVLYAMLFNDFLLFARPKRPLLTKMLQVVNRTMFKHQGYSSKRLVQQSNGDWFDSPDADHLYLIVHKTPIMLHDIRNVRLIESDSTGLQFDYRGRQFTLFANSINERFLWTKSLSDAIQICRQRRLVTCVFRAPESNWNLSDGRSTGKVFIRAIHAMHLPLSPVQKHGNNPYCILEMNSCQRHTTPVLCDTSNLQWRVSFRFFIADVQKDIFKCSIYNRSKYTTDRLLGSVQIPLTLLIERRNGHDETSSISSFATSQFSDTSSLDWKTRVFYLQHSSSNSQISIQYLVCFPD